jgi:dTMP kinase
MPIYNLAGGSEPAVEPETITIPAPPAPAVNPDKVFTPEQVAAAIEKARKEEKDKVYNRLESLEEGWKKAQSDLEAAQSAKQAEIDAAAAAAREAAEAEARKRFEESDAKTLLAEAQKTWEQKFSEIEAAREAEKALFAKEREFNELADFTRSKVQAALDNNEIAPQLAAFVSGNTPAEVEASLEFVKAKSEEIAEAIVSTTKQARAQQRGVSSSGYAPVGPTDTNPGTVTFTPDQLKNMSMQDFAKYRGSLLGAAGTQNNRGLFG